MESAGRLAPLSRHSRPSFRHASLPRNPCPPLAPLRPNAERSGRRSPMHDVEVSGSLPPGSRDSAPASALAKIVGRLSNARTPASALEGPFRLRARAFRPIASRSVLPFARNSPSSPPSKLRRQATSGLAEGAPRSPQAILFLRERRAFGRERTRAPRAPPSSSMSRPGLTSIIRLVVGRRGTDDFVRLTGTSRSGSEKMTTLRVYATSRNKTASILPGRHPSLPAPCRLSLFRLGRLPTTNLPYHPPPRPARAPKARRASTAPQISFIDSANRIRGRSEDPSARASQAELSSQMARSPPDGPLAARHVPASGWNRTGNAVNLPSKNRSGRAGMPLPRARHPSRCRRTDVRRGPDRRQGLLPAHDGSERPHDWSSVRSEPIPPGPKRWNGENRVPGVRVARHVTSFHAGTAAITLRG